MAGLSPPLRSIRNQPAFTTLAVLTLARRRGDRSVSPRDPATLLMVVLAMSVAAAAASYFPARRAMNVNPIVALRGD